MNIRTAVLYKKNLAMLIDDSVRSKMLLLITHMLRSFNCAGHSCIPLDGAYVFDRSYSPSTRATENDLHRLRVLGQIPMQEMRHGVLRQELRGDT